MPHPFRLLFVPLLALAGAVSAQTEGSDLRFNRDIRPILSDRCFRCHGPDSKARKAKLRLDTPDGARAERRSGRAIVPGDPAASLLVRRIRHEDPDERMPPQDSGKTLDADEIARLSRWIEEGAPYERHWSYERLERPPVPASADSAWPRNAIDRFLHARLRSVGLEPAAPATPRALVRRLYFDVLGIPPEPEVVDAFVAAPTEQAWSTLVDRLLTSPHHAERLAMYWLDLVRYGDSCGVHGDQVISMSPYRDWVIRSFHENKPFDDFTREQLAGDLLPGATLSQRVASGYNRLNIKTAEGGAQDKEYLAKYAADRVRTTATVWLGSTLGCAECHDHKFDPFATEDFYRFAAFFADLDHKGYYGGANYSGDWGPQVAVPTRAQKNLRDRFVAEVASLERRYAEPSPDLAAAQRAWEAESLAVIRDARTPSLGEWRSVGPFAAADARKAHDTDFGPESDADAERRYRDGLRWIRRPRYADGKVHTLRGANSATYLWRVIESRVPQRVELSLGSDDSIKLWLNGELVVDKFVSRGVAAGQEKPTVALRAGRNEVLMKICNGTGNYGFYFDVARSGPPPEIGQILQVDRAARTSEQHERLESHFRSVTPRLASLRLELERAKKRLAILDKSMTTSLVSSARDTPRVTRVLERGNWQDETGMVVEPGVPAFLRAGARPASRLSRLDLAAWITSRENPLTARVFVNRLWKLYFGRGLARTLDDLGSQGERPRHPELLDWLAVEFVESGWDVRAIIRLILNSSAYRQSSTATTAARARDPENREFARQARYRHDAEIIRDNALAISGLLVRDEIGGVSVKPYQPEGYWSQLNFPKRTWVDDVGKKQHRRGLYTHWQRTFLHPSLVAFDAPAREECTAERPRSNTPLQALVLLNDPSFVEAARVLGARILTDGGSTIEERMHWLFRRALARAPTEREARTLMRFFEERHARYTRDKDAAAQITRVGISDPAEGVDVADHAAWTAVARAVLNLHETNTRY